MNQKFIRFKQGKNSVPQYGLVNGNSVNILRHAPWLAIEMTGETIAYDQIKLLPPVKPSKIICIGLNYHAHVQASFSADNVPDAPLIFFKPPSSLIATGEDIVLPPESERVDYEAELGLIIGKEGRHIPLDKADEHIFGLTCINDVTARDLQKRDKQWSRAKGFDTFCPAGPEIVTGINYDDILVEGIHNGEIKQSGRTSRMIFNIPFIINYISNVMTLLPGDLISTGTPAGIAPMKPGDSIEVRIEGVGSLVNHVVIP